MRIVLTSFGSTGDVQPFLALAVELRRCGHQPILACSPNFAVRAHEIGVEFAPIGPQLDSAVIRAVITQQSEMTSVTEQVSHFIRVIVPYIPRMFQELKEVCRDAHVLISSPYQPASRMVHDQSRCPFISVHLAPFATVGSKELRDVTAKPINAVRASEGLPPLSDPMGADSVSSILALYAVSRYILRPPVNWQSHQKITGFLFLDSEGWEPDPGLRDFLAKGPPPVVVSFGSVVHESPDAITELLLKAIDMVRCRAIIQHGWSGLARIKLPPNVYATSFVPHGWLFPKASCIVHHGGAGTTAAALRAGVPSVVVPHTLDQPIWAEVARAFGCCGGVLPYRQISAERLAEAIERTRDEARYRLRASEIASKIRAEQGVRSACIEINRVLADGC
jgi:UDP:flavonoid glycosyltransferase YjiC (YdhE family)